MILFRLVVKNKKSKKVKKKEGFMPRQMKVNHPRAWFLEEYEKGKQWCINQQMKECYLRSHDGLLLHAYYFPAENAKRTVLLSHGYRGSGFGDFAPDAQFLHEHECNLLFIDQRSCGESQGGYITFGALEQEDVKRWCWYLANRNKNHLPIYLFGKSMGASSVLMASGKKLPHYVKGIIADCGFVSMKEQFKNMAANWFHLRYIPILLWRLSVRCRIQAGFSMKDADTSYAMAINERPVLFFHGSRDGFVHPDQSVKNYQMCRGPKELVIIGKARHLCCAYQQWEKYHQKLMQFFEKYDGR